MKILYSRRRQASLLVSGQPAKVTPRLEEETAWKNQRNVGWRLSKQDSVFDVFDHRVPACLSLSNTPCSLFINKQDVVGSKKKKWCQEAQRTPTKRTPRLLVIHIAAYGSLHGHNHVCPIKEQHVPAIGSNILTSFHRLTISLFFSLKRYCGAHIASYGHDPV